MENKINAFSSLPNSELSKLGGTDNDTSPVRNVEKDFSTTNQHTKQPENTGEKQPEQPTNNEENPPTEKIPTIPGKEKTRLGKLIKGDLPVKLLDMLLVPTIFLVVDQLGYYVDKKQLRLTSDDKDAIAPAIQDCLDSIEIDFSNPWVNLAVVIGIVYGAKVVSVMPEMKKKQRKEVGDKKGMSEAVTSVLSPVNNEDNDSPIQQFEIVYNKMIDEIRVKRRKGAGDAKQYLADNYRENIISLGKKYGISDEIIQDKLSYVHVTKKRQQKEEEFSLDTE